MKQHFLAIAGLLMVSGIFDACKSAEDTVKETENEVFAIHDQVMPKIDDIMKLRKQLNQRISSLDSLKSNGSAAATVRTDEEREQANRLRTNLMIADSLMMDWMGRYNGDTLAKLSPEDALRYLNGQKEQITDVKTKVNASIEQARQFLGKK